MGSLAVFGRFEKNFFKVSVGGLRGKLARDLCDGTNDDFAAVFQNENVGTDFFYQVEQMRADDDGRPVTSAFQDGIFHPPDPNRIQPGERLVEVNNSRRVKQPASN